LDTFGK
jgi:hypothetical protein